MRNRKEIFDEMESTLGSIPNWMLTLPDELLDGDWEAFKAMELNQTSLSPMQKHLMGVSIASVASCPHMAYWHAQMAMAMGATDTQVDEAYQVARYVGGWSAAIEGMNPEMGSFMSQTQQIANRIKQAQQKAA